MEGNHIFGPLLKTLQEIYYEVPDIFSIGRLECELLVPDCDEGEGLGESLAAPIIILTLTTTTTSADINQLRLQQIY